MDSKKKTVRLGLWSVYFETRKYKPERRSKKRCTRLENRLEKKRSRKNVSGWLYFETNGMEAPIRELGQGAGFNKAKSNTELTHPSCR